MQARYFIVALGGLAVFSSQVHALGCKDIAGAVVDPDLQILAADYGRLLPGRKTISKTVRKEISVSADRLVGREITAAGGKYKARIVLAANGHTTINAFIDGRNIRESLDRPVAGLGLGEQIKRIQAAYEQAGLKFDDFKQPEVTRTEFPPAGKATASRQLVGRHIVKANGVPIKTTASRLMYSCTRDMQFAGDPAQLNTIVVISGVLKAITVKEETATERPLAITISDYTSSGTVSPSRFFSLLAGVPGIEKPVPVPDKTANAAEVRADDIPDRHVTAPKISKLGPSESRAETPRQPERKLDRLESLKPGGGSFWPFALPAIVLVLAVAACIVFLNGWRNRRKLAARDRTEPVEPVEPAIEAGTSVGPEEFSDSINPLNTRLDKADAAVDEKIASSELPEERIACLEEQITGLMEENRQLRTENKSAHEKLSSAVSETRQLKLKMLESRNGSIELKGRANEAELMMQEYKISAHELAELNSTFLENISQLEAERSQLMQQLERREKLIIRAEKLNTRLLGDNEEISKKLTDEQAAHAALEVKFDRLASDYSTFWDQSSSRLAALRKEITVLKGDMRSGEDKIASLEAELERVRDERNVLNREFSVLVRDMARTEEDNRYDSAQLSSQMRQLYMKLAVYEQVLEENNIAVPDMPNLDVVSGTVTGCDASLEQENGREDVSGDNIVVLPGGARARSG